MTDEWGALTEAVNDELEPTPNAICVPSSIDGASKDDAKALAELWVSLQNFGIIIQSPKD